jgi:predicted transcriptional regulator
MKVIGADEPKELLEDNMSWFNRKSLSKGTGFSKHEAAGLMSSLERKGLVVTDDEHDHEYACFVTDEGIELVQRMIEKELMDR